MKFRLLHSMNVCRRWQHFVPSNEMYTQWTNTILTFLKKKKKKRNNLLRLRLWAWFHFIVQIEAEKNSKWTHSDDTIVYLYRLIVYTDVKTFYFDVALMWISTEAKRRTIPKWMFQLKSHCGIPTRLVLIWRFVMRNFMETNSEIIRNKLICIGFWLQVIELDPEQLPDGDEVLSILRQEHSPINTWVNVAVSVVVWHSNALLWLWYSSSQPFHHILSPSLYLPYWSFFRAGCVLQAK